MLRSRDVCWECREKEAVLEEQFKCVQCFCPLNRTSPPKCLLQVQDLLPEVPASSRGRGAVVSSCELES